MNLEQEKWKAKKNQIGKDVLCQPTGTVLDKIQAELAETRRREEELKRSRLSAIIVIAMHSWTINCRGDIFLQEAAAISFPTRPDQGGKSWKIGTTKPNINQTKQKLDLPNQIKLNK